MYVLSHLNAEILHSASHEVTGSTAKSVNRWAMLGKMLCSTSPKVDTTELGTAPSFSFVISASFNLISVPVA